MNRINCKKLILSKIMIKSADNQLYNSGVFMEARPGVKRSLLFSPRFIVICFIFYVIYNIIQFYFINEKFTKTQIVLGDWSSMIGNKYDFKITATLIVIMNLIIESIHYYNYRMAIEPTYLSVFEMMSGLVTPHSIGLNDEKNVLQLLKITKKLFKISKIVQKYNLPFLGSIGFIPYIIYCDLFEIVFYGIPNILYFSLVTYYCFELCLWHLIHFYIIC